MYRTLMTLALCAALGFAQQSRPPESTKPAAGARSQAPDTPKSAALDEVTGLKIDNLQLRAQVTQQAAQQAQQTLQQLGKDFDALVGAACTKAALPAPCKLDKDPAGNWVLIGNVPAPAQPNK